MRRASRRAGFTLLEAMIAATLLTVVMVKLVLVIQETQETHSREVAAMSLKVHGDGTCPCDPGTVEPNAADRIDYMLSLGVEDGETVWSDPESIQLSEDLRVVWLRNEGEPNERLVVWCSSVRALHEGEIANLADDNGNGVFDEPGLSFVMDEDMIVIRVTLEVDDGKEQPLRHTAETRVTCRN